jgi:cyclopropane-fatty-acyl-phospholipid synthase
MSFARKAVLKMLGRIRHGSLELVCPGETLLFGERDAELRACVAVHNERFFSRLLWGGDDAAGDSFVDGDWSSPDLIAVVRLAARNQGQLEGGDALLARAYRTFHRLRFQMQRNTVEGSRRNIHAHYDLSNDFFRLFLDRNMVYSSAVYRRPEDSLEQAQTEKLDHMCRKLRLGPGDRVLEIGTGWGAFALHASRHYGCEVTTTTISREQHDYARQAFAEAGEAGRRITLLLEDYRNLRGTYDKLVSIEMFEAVGLEFYDTFFSACDRLLAPNGSMALQTITMNEQRFAEYSRQSDWIQRRIFPGAQLSSVREILASLARSTKLSLYHLEDIGMHYAYTLAEWRHRFHESMNEVRVLGFDETFCRTWDYYLAFCEGAFRERHIGDVQLVLTKNGNPAGLFGEPWADSIATRHAVSELTLAQTEGIEKS